MGLMDKPVVIEKFRRFHHNVRKNDGKIGTNLRVLELVYNNACNFACRHCSTRAPLGDNAKDLMPLPRVAQLADEAHEMGIIEWNFHGGELLTDVERLFELIAVVRTERFYTFLTSNGYLLTEEIAGRLAKAGIDRVSISIDSMNPEIHDSFRGVTGAYEHAMRALEYVKAAGMAPFMNITVGHYNAFSEDLEKLCQYSFEKGYTTLINIAIPSGNWKGNLDVIIDERDRAHLIELRKKYGNILRDLWNPFDKGHEKCLGCQTMSKLYVTPTGDVLPCSFLHIKIGNVYEKSLKDIVEEGYKIKFFREHSDLCLAGEDVNFIKKYMQGDMSALRPLDAQAVFAPEDRMGV